MSAILRTIPRAMPYSSWFRPTARFFMALIEGLGGERGRSEVTSVMPLSNRYLGTSQSLRFRIVGARAHLPEKIHNLSRMIVRRGTNLARNSTSDMAQVLSLRLGIRPTWLCLLLGRHRTALVAQRRDRSG